MRLIGPVHVIYLINVPYVKSNAQEIQKLASISKWTSNNGHDWTHIKYLKVLHYERTQK